MIEDSFGCRKLNSEMILFNYVFSKTFKSSRPEVFCKNDILRDFAKFTGRKLRPVVILGTAKPGAENICETLV